MSTDFRPSRLNRELDSVWQDLRTGLRTLRRNPGFTAVAVVTLALGIGGNTAVFSVIHSVLLRPLPFPEPDRLVQVVERNPERAREWGVAYERFPVSAHNYRDYREQNTVFSEMGWVGGVGDFGWMNVTGGPRPERLRGKRASRSLFELLGVTPQLGSVWAPERDEFNFTGTRPILISHALWQRWFGGDPDVIGRRLELDQWPHEIVGVMPPGFQVPPVLSQGSLNGDPRLQGRADFFVPLWYNAYGLERGSRQFTVLARLRDDVTVERAQSEMRSLSLALAEQFPEANSGWTAQVLSLDELLESQVGPQLTPLMAAVVLVLLIACANVGNLLLARGVLRREELAVRTALGGGRLRLIRQLLTEGLLLALAGGIAGLALGYVGVRLLVALAPSELPRVADAGVNGPVLLFTLCVALGCGLVFTLVPALRASRVDLVSAMKGGTRALGGRGASRVSLTAMAGEVALALVLLAGAGLLVRGFLDLATQELGYDTEGILAVSLELGRPNAYNERFYECDLESDRPLLWQRCRPRAGTRAGYYRQVVERVEEVPGVRSASLITRAPMRPAGSFPLRIPREEAGPHLVDEATEERSQGPAVLVGRTDGRAVTPGYFETMGIRVLTGRVFRPGDPTGWGGLAVVNQKLAEELWPGENPVGKRLGFWPPPWMTVIGVVENTQRSNLSMRQQDAGRIEGHLYMQDFSLAMDLMIRTERDPGQIAAAVEEAVLEVESTVPLGAVTTMEELVSRSNAAPRFFALLVGIFAGVALTLAAVGLYGVVAFNVAQRTREIGLRVALGARKREIQTVVLGRAALAMLVGTGLGIVGAVAAVRLVSGLIPGLRPMDPVTYVAVAVVLAIVVGVATLVPVRRALRLNPSEALRYE